MTRKLDRTICLAVLFAQLANAFDITTPEDRMNKNSEALAVRHLRSTSMRRQRNNGVNSKQHDGRIHMQIEEDLRLLQIEDSMSFPSVSPSMQPSKVGYTQTWPCVPERKFRASS